ncbi:MAG: hypothetical protein PVSMB7_23350 [Chloroflexota bacterium]
MDDWNEAPMSSRPSHFQFTSPGRMRIYNTAELLTMPPPTWLVADTVPAGGVVGLYAPPNVGKTFLALDMALCVATGTPWHGRDVQPGFVLYVSAEGGMGIGKRVRAWLLEHGIDAKKVNMGWLVEAISVYGESDDLVKLFDRIEEEIEQTPVLIVIDTLARCFDGNENEQEDMGRFIKGVDELRSRFKCTVLILHHTRLDGERERGNTAFRGAADTMISLVPVGEPADHRFTMACSKQRDGEAFPMQDFELIDVPLADSVVLRPIGVPIRQVRRSVITDMIRSDGPRSFTQLLALGLSKSALKRHLVGLRESGEILKKDGIWHLEGPPEK